MQPLFRAEAVAHATQRLDGEVLLPASLVTWGAVAFLVAVLALAAWFAATATFTRTESAEGWLAPDGGVARAVSRRDGTVHAFMVAEGDVVEAGAPLASVGMTREFSSGHDGSNGSSHKPLGRHGDHIVTAPISGRVEALLVREDQYITHGSTVALVAASDELIAEIAVPLHVAGLVTSGQDLRLKYDRLPFGHQGVQQGIVTHVSRAPLTPENSDGSMPARDPVYRAQVRLPAQEIDVGGISVGLHAGMRLTAEIPAPRRTLLQTLYETIQ